MFFCKRTANQIDPDKWIRLKRCGLEAGTIDELFCRRHYNRGVRNKLQVAYHSLVCVEVRIKRTVEFCVSLAKVIRWTNRSTAPPLRLNRANDKLKHIHARRRSSRLTSPNVSLAFSLAVKTKPAREESVSRVTAENALQNTVRSQLIRSQFGFGSSLTFSGLDQKHSHRPNSPRESGLFERRKRTQLTENATHHYNFFTL